MKNTFVYTSICCSKPARKPPLVATESRQGTLGHWRCVGCGKSAKVMRTKA